MKPKLEMRPQPSTTLEVQLDCSCCGQPYYPGKAWEDQLRAGILGAERFAICPICTQSPPKYVFNSIRYRKRCLSEVRRLQQLYEEAQALLSRQNRRTKSSCGDAVLNPGLHDDFRDLFRKFFKL